jgi:hypothetical protein
MAEYYKSAKMTAYLERKRTSGRQKTILSRKTHREEISRRRQEARQMLYEVMKRVAVPEKHKFTATPHRQT